MFGRRKQEADYRSIIGANSKRPVNKVPSAFNRGGSLNTFTGHFRQNSSIWNQGHEGELLRGRKDVQNEAKFYKKDTCTDGQKDGMIFEPDKP